MKTIFMATQSEIKEIEVLSEDEEYYYIEDAHHDKISKKFNVTYWDEDDKMIRYGETYESARDKYNERIYEDIKCYENKINRLKRKLI